MKEKVKHLKPIQNMIELVILVLLSILTTQTSAIAQHITRAQTAVILGQGIHGSNFTPPAATGIFDDVSVNDWGADWIEQFYKDGITNGCGQTPLRYCPTHPVIRARMAIFLLRSKHGKDYTPPQATGIFDDVPVWFATADWIEQLYREKITSGCSASPLRYCPNRAVTGIQMSLFIARAFGGPPAPLPKTGQTRGYQTGDDGDLQKGVQWPVPRFIDNGDGTVTDDLTRLIWLKNPHCIEAKDWSRAIWDTWRNLKDGQCGLSDGSDRRDWRLPNVRELFSLINSGSPWRFPPVFDLPPPSAQVFYWTSTSSSVADKWAVLMPAGAVEALPEYQERLVWPVRGGN